MPNSYFLTKTNVVGAQKNCFKETVLQELSQRDSSLSIQNIMYVVGTQKNRLKEMALLSIKTLCMLWVLKRTVSKRQFF